MRRVLTSFLTLIAVTPFFSGLWAVKVLAAPRPELALQTGHSSRVSTVALSHDGSMVASGSWDKAAKLWDARTGDVLHTLEEAQPALVWDVNFSPDDSLMAVLSSRLTEENKPATDIKLYSTRTGALLHSLPERANGVVSMAFSPDGRWLATGGDNTGIKLWNTQNGALEKSLKGHIDGSDALVFTQQGRHLISASTQDQTLREWDTATGELLHTVTIETSKNSKIAFSADGALLAFGRSVIRDKENRVSGDVTVCNAQTGAMLRVLPSKQDAAFGLAFAPNGQVLAVTSYDGAVKLWNPQTGVLLETLSSLRPIPASEEQKSALSSVHIFPTCAAFSPDSRTLIVGSGTGTVALYDATQPVQLRRTLQGRTDLMQNVSFSADGKLLTSVSISPFEATGATRIWDTQTGTLQNTLSKGASMNRRTAISPDGALRVPPVKFDGAKIEDTKTGAVVRSLKNSASCEHFVFINDGQDIAASYGQTNLRVWSVATGEILTTTKAHKADITDICVSPDGALMASADLNGSLLIWNARSEQPGLLRTIATNAIILSVVFAPDSATLAATAFGRVMLYSARSGAMSRSIEAHDGIVMAAAFSPDGQRMATIGDSTIKVWSARNGRLLTTLISFPPNAKTGAENYLALTPEGYYSGSAEADRYVKFRLGDTLYPAESFQARYYRPDLVKKALAGEVLPPVGDFKGAFPPVAKLGVNLPDKFSGDTITVNLAASDDSAIRSVAFFVNGARVDAKPITAESRPLTADARVLTVTGKALTAESRPLTTALTTDNRAIPESHKTITRYTATLPLPPGATTIKVQAIAFDDDGLQSPRDEVLFAREAKVVSGKLLGLCVGVSQYQDARLNLKFADADAQALSKTLGGQGGLYSEATISALTNEKATGQNIKAKLDHLIAQSTRADTIIISLSGHGWRDDERNFYFATYEVNRNDVSHSALAWHEVTARLMQLSQRSKRVIVLLDACHSGSAATNEELVKATLSANAGVLVFASSRGSEVSLENAEWGHGAFTKALLEAIAGQASAPGEAEVSMLDFLGYVARRVKTLTGDQQHPQVPFLQDFDTDAILIARL